MEVISLSSRFRRGCCPPILCLPVFISPIIVIEHMQTPNTPPQTPIQLVLTLLLDPQRNCAAKSIKVGLVLVNLSVHVARLGQPIITSLDGVFGTG
jgi:hypothetical protein